MRVTTHHSLLTATVPMGQALQMYIGQDTCSWSSLSLSHEQYMCASVNVINSPEDVQSQERSHHRTNAGDLESNVWSTSPECFDEYCVYTNNDFLGQGISLVTTARNRDRVAHIQLSETVSRPDYEKTRIVDIPAKGKGLVATRTIRRGERIMAVSPALLVHRNAFMELPLNDFSSLMDMAVNSLLKPKRESYLAQASTMGGHKTIDILFTNSFQVALGDHDGFHYGNFPDASILNHDCRPK
jgi:hypothetical protein